MFVSFVTAEDDILPEDKVAARRITLTDHSIKISLLNWIKGSGVVRLLRKYLSSARALKYWVSKSVMLIE